IGYGVQKKSDLTGSVASVREDDLKNRATSDAAAALQGKAAGVQVIQASGAPGKAAEIRVRGYSSNSGNIGPLLIVDGLKVDNIQYLDPEMIESMEILKDAASAAIYGAEAGNGVVLITTKTGAAAKGEGKIFYNAQFQLSSLSRKLDIMNAADYIAFGKANGYLSDNTLNDYYDGRTDVNWSDEIFVPTWSNRHTVGFQGGNDRGNLFVSLNNVHNNGIFRGDKDVYDRLTFQVNADYKIKDWLTIGVNNSIERWKTKSVSEANDNGSALLSAITSSPLFPVRGTWDQLTAAMRQNSEAGYKLLTDPETGLYWTPPLIGATQSGHPFVQRDATDSSSSGFNIRGVAYINFMPFKGFTFTSRFGYRITQSTSHSYTEPYYAAATNKADNYNMSANANTGFYYQWENFANYNRSFGKHDVSAMVGMSFIENNWDNVSASASASVKNPGGLLKGYTENFLSLDYILTDGVTKSVGNTPGRSASLSYFGRLAYTYDNRYSIQANFRADAFDSSKLPADSRWGYFPSVSAGWTISNEPFFRDNVDHSLVNFLKLRASWGINGNINVLSGYPYLSSIKANAVYYQYDATSTTLSMGSIPSGLANPNLRWETSVQLDFGLDARLFNNRLTVGLDYFNKDTKDLLVGVSPAKEVGLPAFGDLGTSTTVTTNAGSVNNKGIELELGWRDQIGDFSYSINANGSWLKNMVTYVDPTVGRISGRVPQGCNMGTYFEEGHSIWYLLGYEAIGVDGEGNALYRAADGTTTTSPGDGDRVDLGSGIPKFTYGLTINLAWKGFDLTIFGNGISGSKIFPTSFRVDRPECNTYSYYWNNSWKKSGDESWAKFPAANHWTTEAFSSTFTLFDGSYFKIKQIQLGYTLPQNLTKKAKINHLRVFASLENYFTFTKYIGLDPETATNGGSAAGIDMGNYPTAKSLILGFNLEF
ncbi:MAG: SusC/RagA family TonB-linked outer membrane protein, partial [Bacteroidales bacterium]|nr:SusC/RagA family TonB-linked outer membrane protein [Bacteroidales bacterium]